MEKKLVHLFQSGQRLDWGSIWKRKFERAPANTVYKHGTDLQESTAQISTVESNTVYINDDWKDSSSQQLIVLISRYRIESEWYAFLTYKNDLGIFQKRLKAECGCPKCIEMNICCPTMATKHVKITPDFQEIWEQQLERQNAVFQNDKHLLRHGRVLNLQFKHKN